MVKTKKKKTKIQRTSHKPIIISKKIWIVYFYKWENGTQSLYYYTWCAYKIRIIIKTLMYKYPDMSYVGAYFLATLHKLHF